MQSAMQLRFRLLVPLLVLLPLVTADCNIDSAGVKTYSSSDGLVISRVGVTATFRLGCSHDSKEPKLHAETGDGQYLVVSSNNLKGDMKQVSFVEETSKSKSRWIEIRVYDDDTYQKLLAARSTGASESYYKPMKTISVSHYGVTGGPMLKMESLTTLALMASMFIAYRMRSKIVN